MNRRLSRTRAASSTSSLMKDNYDFLTAKRGKFFREGARLGAFFGCLGGLPNRSGYCGDR